MKKHCAAAMAGRRGHGRCLRRPLSVAAGPLPRHARAGVQTRWPRGGARRLLAAVCCADDGKEGEREDNRKEGERQAQRRTLRD